MNNHEERIARMEEIIKENNLEVDSQNDHDNHIYKIRTNELMFLVTLKPDFIGYELELNQSVLGHKIGSAVDTDNYKLGGSNSDITDEIFNEILTCVEAIANKDIYVAKVDDNLLLAIPMLDGEFKLKTVKPKKRWWNLETSTESVVSKDDLLAKYHARPLA